MNAQSATNKTDELAMLCDDLKPDVLVVSEHGFNDDNVVLFKIDNYSLAASYQRQTFKWGGVALFVKENIQSKPFKTPENVDLDFEVKGLTVRSKNSGDIIIIGLYRSPRGCFNSFFVKLDVLLKTVTSKKINFIILGDFNINVLDKTNPQTQRLKDLLSIYGLKWSIDSPTRVTLNSSTAIDNVITNLPDASVSVFDVAISDHYAQLVTVPECAPVVKEYICNVKRVTRPQNIANLVESLNKEPWEFLNHFDCPDKCLTLFMPASFTTWISFAHLKEQKLKRRVGRMVG